MDHMEDQICLTISSLKNFQNKKIDVYNNFKHSRDFTFISDVINLILKCHYKISKSKKKINEIYNVGSGKKTTLRKLIYLLEKNFMKKFKFKLYNKQLGDIEDTLANINKAKKELDYNPKISFSKVFKNLQIGFNFITKNENWFIEFGCR